MARKTMGERPFPLVELAVLQIGHVQDQLEGAAGSRRTGYLRIPGDSCKRHCAKRSSLRGQLHPHSVHALFLFARWEGFLRPNTASAADGSGASGTVVQ